jgi:uncharacterized protein (DUF433 family)
VVGTVTIEPLSVPLHVDEDGTIRVGGTRLIIDLIIHAYNKGRTPEDIVRSYDAVSLSDIYTVIGYYLHHRAELDAYVAQREAEAQQLRDVVTSTDDYKQRMDRLLTRRVAKHGS